MSANGLLRIAAVLLLASTISQFANAQAVYGSTNGTLTDVSGKPIGGAKVTISSLDKGTKFTTLTDSSGFYVVNDVPPDDYSLKIEAGGFKTFQDPLVPVYADNTSTVNPKLVAGSTSEVVTGSVGDVSVLKIDRTDVSTILSRQQVQDLPLPEQNVSRLEVLAPGAVPVTPVLSRSQNPQQGTYINVNGQIFSGTAYQLDGTDNRDPLEGIVVINPNQDSVGEMKITTQNYSAEFGEATAGVVTVQTKSGSNALHGSLFAYNQTGIGEAPSPDLVATSSTGAIILPLDSNVTQHRNQFGGSIGGPILKDHLFFFGDYRGTRDVSGATLLLTVPTMLAHTTCDSAASTTCNLSEYGGATNLTPNPATAYLISLLPQPNLGTGLTNNFQITGREPLKSDDGDLRLDYDTSQRLKIFGRYSYDQFQQDGAPAFGIAGGPGTNPDNFAGRGRTYNQSASAGFSYSLSSHLLTDVRFGFLQYHLDLNAPDFGTFPVANVPGLQPLNNSLYSSDLPDIQLDGLPGTAPVTAPATTSNFLRLGYAAFLRFGYSAQLNNCNCPLREREQQYQFVNNWTKLAGHHTIRWGGDFRYIRNFRLDSASTRSGFLEFNDISTLVGGTLNFFDRTFLPANPAALDAAERQKRAFFYGEDTWRVNSRLTLNYGLRWEIYFPQYLNQAGAGGFLLIHNNVLPAIDAATVNVAGSAGVNLQGNVQNTYRNLGPRIGFAYLAGSKTVIRAGYSRTFDVGYSGSIFGIAATQNPPVSSVMIGKAGCNLDNTKANPCAPAGGAAPDYFTPAVPPPSGSFTVQQLCIGNNPAATPAPVGQNCTLSTAIIAGPPLQTALNALPDKMRLPTVDAWNLTVQHEISPNMYLEVAYVGNKGTHVLTDPSATLGSPITLASASFYNLNQPTLAGVVQPVGSKKNITVQGFSCKPTASSAFCLAKEFEQTPLAPWNQPVNYYGNDASNNFNSLQVKFNKRFSSGYSVLANYVYSKVLDYDSNYFAIDPGIGYGPGNFDRRHTFTMANIWNLPIGRGRPLLHDLSPAADKLIGGWSLQALTSWFSGLPFTPQYSNCVADLSFQGINTPPCRPNLVGNVSITGSRNTYYTATRNFTGTGDPTLQSIGGTSDNHCGVDSAGNPLPGAAIGPWQRPGCGQIGDSARNSLRGPRLFQSDVAIMKEIRFTERVSLRLRADAFNVFNHVNLGQPYPVVDAAQAGTISTTVPGAFQREFEFSARVQF